MLVCFNATDIPQVPQAVLRPSSDIRKATMEGHRCRGDSSSSNPRRQLPIALQLHILSLLPPNERALSGRLVSPEARDGLTGPQHCTASLSQPLPCYAASWAVAAGQGYVRQLPFRHKVRPLCAAAASGSEVNLEVALALLQPSIFPELLRVAKSDYCGVKLEDPSVAAVKAGHPQLLGWLLRHCPALLQSDKIMSAAAQHCDVTGLQAVWEVLQGRAGSSGSSNSSDSPPPAPVLDQSVLDAAAGSVTPDAVAKMKWVLEAGGGSCSLRASTAEAAMRSGDLVRLRWLRRHGCPLHEGNWDNLALSLGTASLAVAQWLVDEAGCELPAAGSNTEAEVAKWRRLLSYTAQGPDGVAKLRWLQECGAPATEMEEARPQLTVVAVLAGQLEVLQYLTTPAPGSRPDVSLLRELDGDVAVFGFGRVPNFAMLDCLEGAGAEFTWRAYLKAARVGHVGAVRWLASRVRAENVDMSKVMERWPSGSPADSRDLLEAVQLLVGAGCAEWEPSRVTENAIRRGHLGLTQYVVGRQGDHVLGWSELHAAAGAGCEALLEWVVQQPGCMESQRSGCPYTDPAKNGDRGTLAALRRLGVPWGAEDVVVRAVREGSCMAAVRWLVDQGAPVGSREDMEEAVECRWALGDEEAAWLRGLV